MLNEKHTLQFLFTIKLFAGCRLCRRAPKLDDSMLGVLGACPVATCGTGVAWDLMIWGIMVQNISFLTIFGVLAGRKFDILWLFSWGDPMIWHFLSRTSFFDDIWWYLLSWHWYTRCWLFSWGGPHDLSNYAPEHSFLMIFGVLAGRGFDILWRDMGN